MLVEFESEAGKFMVNLDWVEFIEKGYNGICILHFVSGKEKRTSVQYNSAIFSSMKGKEKNEEDKKENN